MALKCAVVCDRENGSGYGSRDDLVAYAPYEDINQIYVIKVFVELFLGLTVLITSRLVRNIQMQIIFGILNNSKGMKAKHLT